MKKIYMLSLLMLIFIAGNTYAPQPDEVPSEVVEKAVDEAIKNSGIKPTKFKVGVFVQCDDESLKNLIESHIKRELRALHDVEVHYGMHSIKVVVLEHIDIAGRKTGSVSLAYLFLRNFNFYNLEPYVEPYLSHKFTFDDIMDDIIMDDLTPGDGLLDPKIPALYENYILGVVGVGINNINQACQSIVANFDIEMLESERKKR